MTSTAIATATRPTQREQAYLEQQPSYHSATGIWQIWAIAAERFGDTPAICDPHAKPEVSLTFDQLWETIQTFASGLQALDVETNSHVALISENHPRWLIADQGVMAAGAVDVVRSSQAERDELLYILAHSDATTLIVENQKTLDKLQDHLSELPIDFAILLSDEEPQSDSPLRVVNFQQVMEQGQNFEWQAPEPVPDDLATLLYTSGTTGKPKGVMLTHANLLHQINTLGGIIQPQPGDRVLSILPTWHIYERTGEYFVLSQGMTLFYTDLRHFKGDLKELQPQYFISVPRLLQAIRDGIDQQIGQQSSQRQRVAQVAFDLSRRYIRARRIRHGLSLDCADPSAVERLQARATALALAPAHKLSDRLVYQTIREGIGDSLKQIINGGGSLTRELDLFFEIIGVDVIVGYGLTETSPVLTARRYWENLRGSAGKPIPGTEICIVDSESRQTLAQGEQGSVLARGPQIMAGYYKNPEATEKAIDADGWFDTEDLGWMSPQQDLVLTGRVKDTIVLSNGENVEPEPIEEACSRSKYIDQIVVVGQDQASLGALIVPNFDAIAAWAEKNQVDFQRPDADDISAEAADAQLNRQPFRDLFRRELNREVQDRPGYSRNDRIGPFHLLAEPFAIEKGTLTQTLKIKRPVVMQRYQNAIETMFS